MPTMSRTLFAAFACAMLLPCAPAMAQQDEDRVCRSGFDRAPANDSDFKWTINFSYRTRDGNMTAEVKGLPYAAMEGKDEQDNYPMTLEFDTGVKLTSRSGGYVSGFRQYVWGGFGPEKSPEVWAALANAKSVRVRFDKMDLGVFDFGLKGLARSALNVCLKGGMNG